ncbi:MAG: bifunctional ornithine acetyltransferase/N-acetylglutamate synthase, partial [Eubacterium sp.]
MKNIKGGILAAKGFLAAGIDAGIKTDNVKDMALIYAKKPAVTAIMTTSNVVKAAPVMWDTQVMKDSFYKQAIVVNSGNANACTGEIGKNHVLQTAKKAAELLGIQKEDVLVSSTGVIGVALPIDKILNGIETLIPNLGS